MHDFHCVRLFTYREARGASLEDGQSISAESLSIDWAACPPQHFTARSWPSTRSTCSQNARSNARRFCRAVCRTRRIRSDSGCSLLRSCALLDVRCVRPDHRASSRLPSAPIAARRKERPKKSPDDRVALRTTEVRSVCSSRGALDQFVHQRCANQRWSIRKRIMPSVFPGKLRSALDRAELSASQSR